MTDDRDDDAFQIVPARFADKAVFAVCCIIAVWAVLEFLWRVTG